MAWANSGSKGNGKNADKVITYNFPFLGLLTLIFITLKLTNNLDWPWVWILSPIWIPIGIFGILFLAIGIVYTILLVIEKNRKNK